MFCDPGHVAFFLRRAPCSGGTEGWNGEEYPIWPGNFGEVGNSKLEMRNSHPERERKKKGGGFRLVAELTHVEIGGFGLIYVGFLIIRVNWKDKGPVNIAFPSGQRVGRGEEGEESDFLCNLPYLSYLQCGQTSFCSVGITKQTNPPAFCDLRTLICIAILSS